MEILNPSIDFPTPLELTLAFALIAAAVSLPAYAAMRAAQRWYDRTY